MTIRPFVIPGAALLLAVTACVHLTYGIGALSYREMAGTLMHGNVETYEQSVLLYQRLPRALIALYVGATTAVSGMVFQGLVRNPLASPSTLGVNSGATLFVIAGAFVFDLGTAAQGMAALAGAVFGFATCLGIARMAGRTRDPRGLSLILSGALTSMLLVGMTNALLLSDPTRRAEFLGWVAGNINHVYIDRLADFWWIGAGAIALLFALARPMTLILLGEEKAASAGVDVARVSWAGLIAAMLAAGSAVAICGPIGFIGLVVPHIVRPLVGANFSSALPTAAFAGATLCLVADLLAQTLFTPYVPHTGLLMDLLGGLVFIVIVKRFYLSPAGAT
ncbi:FecCD family ABC transporter permease [Rhizobium halophytocola]|uniref:Iron complex transport system permease protein n=1 Tax=Rhizobium halophytocola TaxID=735519 RepID=A0ABS4DV46_9HYPH|nr:iron ABC transporter permease [Rhizobium halophytocola]MBP1849569.1 iron complex transport system permease protein [Rhizobium halophytocola]